MLYFPYSTLKRNNNLKKKNQRSERHCIIPFRKFSEAISSEAIMAASMQLIKKNRKKENKQQY